MLMQNRDKILGVCGAYAWHTTKRKWWRQCKSLQETKPMDFLFVMQAAAHQRGGGHFAGEVNFEFFYLMYQLFLGCKGALDNILKFSFWLKFIYHVKIDC